MRAAIAFLVGITMAVALALSGMTQPAKVIGFLDFTGAFDPSLMFVMGGAVGVHFLLYRLIRKLRERPILDAQFYIPPRSRIDRKLLVGAFIFGVGWGLAGFCPGPALVSFGAVQKEAMIFVAAMIAGQWLAAAYEAWQARSAAPANQAA